MATTYDYNEYAWELHNQGVIPIKFIYNYAMHSMPDIFEALFDAAQVNLNEVCPTENINIAPARFYFFDRESVNAYARYSKKHGYYTIEIYRGTIDALYDLFCTNLAILEDARLADYKQFNAILEGDKFSVSLSYMMMQSATMFTYYHELAHLIQYSNQNSQATATSNPVASIQESYSVDTQSDFLLMDHIVEFDADWHGANIIANHVIDFWREMGAEKTNENLKNLAVSSIVGCLGYIMLLLNDFDKDIYYKEKLHPHPLIRINWIIGVIVDRIGEFLTQFGPKDLVNESLRVLDIYFEHLGKGTIQNKFIEPLNSEYPNIIAYIDEIIQAAESVPFLAVNTVHKPPIVP